MTLCPSKVFLAYSNTRKEIPKQPSLKCTVSYRRGRKNLMEDYGGEEEEK